MDNFIEQMGLIAQADGVPPIAGQILGYLVVDGNARTLAEMTEALGISKASASTNARLLEQRGVVRKIARLGRREDAYIYVDEANSQILHNLSRRFLCNAEAIAQSGSNFPDSHADARERVARLADFYRRSAEFLARWAEEFAPKEQLRRAPTMKKETTDDQV